MNSDEHDDAVLEEAPVRPAPPPRVNKVRVLPKPPVAPPPDKTAGRIVNVNCRAGNGGCGSQQVEIRSTKNIPTGGRAIRYRCLKCKQIFQINL